MQCAASIDKSKQRLLLPMKRFHIDNYLRKIIHGLFVEYTLVLLFSFSTDFILALSIAISFSTLFG